MSSRVDVRAVDIALVAVLLGAGTTVYTKWGGNLLDGGLASLSTANFAACACAGAIGVLSLLVAYLSYSRAQWISKYHLSHYDDIKHTLVRPQRKAGSDIPCPYPDAWYAVSFSQELPPGTVLPLVVCNQNLIVFRPQLKPGQTTWPAPAVLDAYCTHLGAHLALGGGRVEGDCVRCPFHSWCFDSTGKLVSTPTGDVPPGADIRSWPVLERNGVIAVWMSSTVHKDPLIMRQAIRPAKGGGCNTNPTAVPAAGAAGASSSDKAPSHSHSHGSNADRTPEELSSIAKGAATVPNNMPWFTIPVFAGLHTEALGSEEAGMVYHGCTENTVNSVLWENPENGADVAHLNALHAEFILPALYPFLSHRWEGMWGVRETKTEAPAPGIPTGVIADMDVKEAMVLMRWLVLPGEVAVHITQCGPSQVFIDMNTPVGRCIVIETVTPVAPRTQRVLHACYAARGVPRIAAKAILFSVMAQYEKDVPIWSNKVYHPRPMLAKHDPCIASYRRWARKFVQPGAITYAEAMKAHVADQLGLPAESGLEW